MWRSSLMNVKLTQKDNQDNWGARREFYQLGCYCFLQGKYTEAENIFRQLKELKEKLLKNDEIIKEAIANANYSHLLKCEKVFKNM